MSPPSPPTSISSRGLRPPLAALVFILCTATAYSHPVPRQEHERTVVVHLTPDGLKVDYQLAVDGWTVFRDLASMVSADEREKLGSERECYDAYLRSCAPIIADKLTATLDGEGLELACEAKILKMQGHPVCEYVFRAPWKLVPGKKHVFTLEDFNFPKDPGKIRLSFAEPVGAKLERKVAPPAELMDRHPIDLQPADERRLRRLSATLTLPGGKPPAAVVSQPSPPAPANQPTPPAPSAQHADSDSGTPELLRVMLDTKKGLWLVLVVAAWLGAAHALTPGHGKTLVAAYLVGEHGTVFHALLLGLVTTLTHTGIVILVAVVLWLIFPDTVPGDLQTAFGVLGGLLVAGLGVWLLLRRLSGGPDHIHLGGSGHHHHHHPGHDHSHDAHADHFHDDQGHAHPLLGKAAAVSTWGLVVMGVSGGIIPCWDAIAMLGWFLSTQRLGLGILGLLAFSAGLASVLIVIGVLVVKAKGFAGSHWGESRFVRALPLVSAVVVTCLGLWLCYDSLEAGRMFR